MTIYMAHAAGMQGYSSASTTSLGALIYSTTSTTFFNADANVGTAYGMQDDEWAVWEFTPLQTGWWHSYVAFPSGLTSATEILSPIIEFRDTDDTMVFRFYLNVSRDLLFQDPSGTYNSLGPAYDDGNFRADVDIQWSIANSGGYVDVYIDGARVINFTGDTQPGTSTQIASFKVYSTNDQAYTQTTSSTLFLSETLISDVSTIGSRVFRTKPTSNGGATDWTGAYTDIDDIEGEDVSTYITSSTNLDDYTAASTDTVPALSGTQEYTGLVVNYTANQVVSSPVTNVSPILRDPGTTTVYTGTSQSVPTAAFTPNFHVFTTNPNGGGAWDKTGIELYEFGLRAQT